MQDVKADTNQRRCQITKVEALRFANDEAEWVSDYGLALGVVATDTLISKIYDDFEEQLDMEKRKSYLDGSNDCFKALKEAGKLK